MSEQEALERLKELHEIFEKQRESHSARMERIRLMVEGNGAPVEDVLSAIFTAMDESDKERKELMSAIADLDKNTK